MPDTPTAGFWTSSFEPLRQYRWYMSFGVGTENTTGKLMDEHIYTLKKVDKPKMKLNTFQHKFVNHYYNFPGRVEWEEISLTVAATQESSKAFYAALTGANYTFDVAAVADNKYKNISKSKFKSTTGNLKIIQIDAEGNELETWQLINPIFTSIQNGSLDYSSDEIVDITCNIAYDYAKFTLPGAGGGGAAGGAAGGTGQT